VKKKAMVEMAGEGLLDIRPTVIDEDIVITVVGDNSSTGGGGRHCLLNYTN